ncbi:PREDICTED: sterile alpha motif domain-containing protein 15 [Condylura cristata]|uniref:sterile alpha motif domain-containing protein 15 n=1 Tax=Condylura cristata TaxID=143302 RepID=UPI0003347BC0|nr:PREDICTED: sterile alpha motif domain-containing protein 15 [Condylura cristata]
MADVPEGYYSDPYGNEDQDPETSELSESLKVAEDAQPEPTAETADPELHVETEKKPQQKAQPEVEAEDSNEEAPESAKDVHAHLKPVELSEEIPAESEDLVGEMQPLEVHLEGIVELGEELHGELEVSVNENHEPDPELPKETESEVPGATISETRLELQENVLEESTREQDGEIELQSINLAKPEFPSEKSRNSIKEADIQLPKMTTLQVPEVTQRKSHEEERTEQAEQAKPESPEDTQRKSAQEIGTETSEQTKSESPDQKPSKSPEETPTKSTEENVPETLEEIKSEFPEEKSKPHEKRDIEPSEKTKPVQEETQRKSSAEKVLEPPEDSEQAHQKDKQRKSTEETSIAQPQESMSGETLKTSESTEKRSEETEPEVQEKTQTELTKEKDLELTDKDRGLYSEDTHVHVVKEYEAESIQNSQSTGIMAPYDYYQMRKLRERVKKHFVSESFTASELDSTSTNYSFYKSFQNIYEDFDDSHSDYSSVYQNYLQESTSVKGSVDLSPELKELVPKGKKRQSKSKVTLQFDFLSWSPERVAEWISELGFPQYKECFTTNFISGQKLIHVNCSNLPQMGITDFEDMKVISQHTRELLGIEEPLFSRSISLPYRDNIGLFLEQKGHSGVKSDSLTFPEFVEASGLQDYAPQITDPEENETH